MTDHTVPIRFRRASTLTLGWNNLILLLEAFWDPMVLVLTLWFVAYNSVGRLTPPYLLLSVIIFAVTFPGTARLETSGWDLLWDILLGWMTIAGLLLFFGYASGYIGLFDHDAVSMWLVLAPSAQLVGHLALRRFAPSLREMQGVPKRIVIAGINDHGIALGQEIVRNPYIATRVMGFFDDRNAERVEKTGDLPLLGKLDQLPQYVKQHQIDAIYLSLPMATHPRMLRLLDDLSDTTASIYFVPDIFIAEVMQGRMDSVGEIPVVAVCETPFSGINRIVKRLSDIVLSIVILILISPLLLVIAIGVKTSSPGPIIFRQRRYGLNGEEIVVFKFRTMTTCEDNGEFIQQARKNDRRVTSFGAFLRRSSLDELPQFFNVIQGRMSIVGPRPHAVAHNELYRKIIKGYMVRHKVKPGVTGWAQVNGCRGETDTVEKMKKRIDYDLAYLRNWSLLLDIYIIFKTIFVVLDDRNAY
jgi:putative colanic acid biosynthesis UDP-glucose lipid carrier transferase